jgi:hypothetical protein
LLVTAAKEEARFYDGDLPLLVTGIEKINVAVRLASVLAGARRSPLRRPRGAPRLNKRGLPLTRTPGCLDAIAGKVACSSLSFTRR